jgi:hypothetical protein
MEVVAEQDSVDTAVHEFVEVGANLGIGTEPLRLGHLALVLVADGENGGVFQRIDDVDEGTSAPETENAEFQLLHDDFSCSLRVF